ncbi:GAF domain-containing protein [Hymenobacter endophyticus]|uniref:GAF domain-containing protein n=1 Tax=Hymenobacter endophyticus TaxID=3076335 RepID=A0ABU3TE67_9BACT|nr:GAF domain-containing protein [Hymenobacter endophyticus]MDU0369658.1 GAF domain-containing protein [Hymenobacter endophyticus]
MSFTSLIPEDDAQRLQALAPYQVLGSVPDAVFDELVRLTAKLFSVPIALVSLVEQDTVWFKANFGLAGAERVARDESFCSVAILQRDVTIYEDLQKKPCELVSPTVADALQLRFYAGTPLRTTEGVPVGALCVIDRNPRQLSAQEQGRLQKLADVVMQLLDLRLLLKTKQPVNASAIWLQLYQHLDQSLTRLDTLSELLQWETDAASESAVEYQQSIAEEADFVADTLSRQIDMALRRVTRLP